MTPECPKAPERGARPEEAVHAAAEAVITAVLGKGVYAEFADFQREFWRKTMTEALAAADAASQSEVERLTAEVERLRTQVGNQCDEFNAMSNEMWSKVHRAREESIKNGERATEEFGARMELQAEVSRLREQLAAQPKLPATAVDDLVEFWHTSHDRMFLDDAARAFLGRWGVSSSEVEAPQPQEMTQHKVNVVVAKWDPLIAFATCRECLEKISGDAPFVQDWADKHEADTLRPQVESPNLQANQHDEGRPSGSGRLAPRSEPTFSVDEMMAAGWETAVAQGERDLLMRMAGELLEQCTEWDDQYGACAEAVPDPACRIRAIVNRYAIQEDAAQAARSEATPRTWDINASEPREVGLKVKGDTNGVVFERREVSHDPARWRALPPEGDGGYYSWRVMNHGLFAEAQSFTEVLPRVEQEKRGGETDD